MNTPILSTIQSPEDVKRLSREQLEPLCEELRQTIVETVAANGGHLASNLGVVELTVALHRVFSCPQDQIVWDVGHQCYTHKLLTGRRDRFETLRKTGGVSGFPKPGESDCDAFVVGHSSTAVSAANGIAKAKALTGDEGYTIAVVGDGAMTGGLAYEGLCNGGRSHDRLIVILNDNQMSISRNVGFMARHLSELRASVQYVQTKKGFGNVISAIPLIGKPLYRGMVKIKSALKDTLYKSSEMFEEMGYYYLGPVDGHNLRDLTRALETAKHINRPVLLHVATVKGQGYSYALENPDTYHGISRFDVASGQAEKGAPGFSQAAGKCLCTLAEQDPRLCVITAAMMSGTGLTEFASRYPKRCFDVGIAEEHAVTFSSGLAVGGALPVFAVYSTFLQRAYDQLLNDTAIMNNHIVLAIDRAGIVPDDGETHQGIFDVPFLTTVPNTTIYSPSNFAELEINLKQALYDTEGIAAVRYPKGAEAAGLSTYEPDYQPYTMYRDPMASTLVITYGRLFGNVLQAAKRLRSKHPVSVLKLTKIWPIPEDVFKLAGLYSRVIFFEESSYNGSISQQFGAALLQRKYGGTYEPYAIHSFIPTCSVADGLRATGLDAEGMVRRILGEANGRAE
ncbi:MAG: 1-deoxy-D-xylulose-5-phosphate synthase [Clostridia bacterium]|nr:1-deoxy-D-xylulose-5-phosphate synthase [Clostridia bacterium]